MPDAPVPAPRRVPLPAQDPAPDLTSASRHLVVVTTRPVAPGDDAAPGAVLVARFWHPRDRKWSENFFESLEHAIRLYVDESGWTLLQQQDLAAAHEHELIFQARTQDFQGPSTEEILKEVGLNPDRVKRILDRPR